MVTPDQLDRRHSDHWTRPRPRRPSPFLPSPVSGSAGSPRCDRGFPPRPQVQPLAEGRVVFHRLRGHPDMDGAGPFRIGDEPRTRVRVVIRRDAPQYAQNDGRSPVYSRTRRHRGQTICIPGDPERLMNPVGFEETEPAEALGERWSASTACRREPRNDPGPEEIPRPWSRCLPRSSSDLRACCNRWSQVTPDRLPAKALQAPVSCTSDDGLNRGVQLVVAGVEVRRQANPRSGAIVAEDVERLEAPRNLVAVLDVDGHRPAAPGRIAGRGAVEPA